MTYRIDEHERDSSSIDCDFEDCYEYVLRMDNLDDTQDIEETADCEGWLTVVTLKGSDKHYCPEHRKGKKDIKGTLI